MDKKFAQNSQCDSRGKPVIDCAECERGGNGTVVDEDKCACGWNVTVIHQGCCFLGTLLEGLMLKP